LHNNTEFSSDEIVAISGRGGTSGVGINTYFKGGFVFDVGKKSESGNLLPSHGAEKRKKLPLAIGSVHAPEWEVGICMPLCIEPLSELQESKFFADACPIMPSSAYEINYHVSYGLLPSVMEADREIFALAVKNIQDCEWKRLERANYGDRLVAIERELYAGGANAVGMSSLGPCLFFISKNGIDLSDYKGGALDKCNIFKTKINNSGRVVKVV
jgi:beta-ribofuranosylaminobenzene 5'-phosphate synthase